MVKVLESFEPSRNKHPWGQWMDGRAYRAVQGVDFHCSVNGFRSTLYTHGSRVGRVPKVAIKGAGVVEFQFPKRKRRDAR